MVNVRSVYNFSKFDSEPESITLFFHELTHVLGFSPFLWPHFLTQPVVKTFFQDGKKIDKIVSLKVLEKARKHLNCSTLNLKIMVVQAQQVRIGNQGICLKII